MAFKFVLFAACLAIAKAGAPLALSAPAYTASYAAPTLSQTYSAAPAFSYATHAAPAYSYSTTPTVSFSAAPALSYAHAAPALSYAHAAPALSYDHASPALSYTHAAPAISYAAPAITKVAAPVAYAAPVAKTIIAEPSAPAHYDFGYAVNDPHTGDSKSQQESRRGDVVQGSYSLIDSDGTKRTVEYAADAHNGFNAVVHKEPLTVAIKAVAPIAKIAAPVSYAAPAITKVAAAPAISYAAAPAISYAAPALGVAKYAAAPALSYAAPALGVAKYSAAPALSYASHVPSYYH